MTKGETLELREPITKDDLVAEVCLFYLTVTNLFPGKQ